MNRAPFPHCDPRILHAPSECLHCDKYPDWQDLRKAWHIAFTGGRYVKPSDDPAERVRHEGAALPCPFDLIRGDSTWAGNQSVSPIAGKCHECQHEVHQHGNFGCFARKLVDDNGSLWKFICPCTKAYASFE